MTRNQHNKPAEPKMTRQQAITLWNSLTPQQKVQFNEMMQKMGRGDLMLKEVNVDDNEQIQNIVLEPKEAPSASPDPFYKMFKTD